MRLVPIMAMLLAFLTGLAISMLHLNDQVNWQSYYDVAHLFGKNCGYKVEKWTGDFEPSRYVDRPFTLFEMPHRGKENPPRAFEGEVLITECRIEKLPDETTYLGIGKVYGESALFLNNDLLLVVPHGEDLLLTIPFKYLGSELRMTLVSKGSLKGNVGLATLFPPYWTTERSQVLAIQRFISSLFSEQAMLRLGLALSFVFLLGVLWKLGRRFDDVSWVLCFATAICLLNFIRFTYQFRLPYFEFSRRVFSASYFLMMFFELMFLASFLRVDSLKKHMFKVFLPVYIGVSFFTLAASPTVFFQFRMLLILPSALGALTMMYFLIYLFVKMRAGRDMHPLLKKRLRTVMSVAALTAFVLGVQAILDDRFGIYVDSSVQMGLLGMVGFLSIKDLFERESDWKSERETRIEIEKKSEVTRAMVATIGFVAHDMRRPIQIMKSYLDSSKGEQNDPATLQLSTAIESAEGLLVDLFCLSPDMTIDLAPIDLSQALEEAWQLSNLNRSQGVQFLNQITETMVTGHKNSLVRVFSNIFINAAEASAYSTQIACRSELSGEDLVVRVTNSNSSIPKEDWERVFDINVSIGKRGGSGLGLAFSKLIVEKMRGSIWTTSEARTCTFYIKIPVSHSTIAKVDPANVSVAVIDDDPIVLDLWRGDGAFKCVDTFSNPENFLSAWLAKRYDVIVCDYQFRNSFMNGVALGQHLKDQGFSGKLILASFHPNPQALGGIFDAKCDKGPGSILNYLS